MVVSAAPVLPVVTDVALHRFQRFISVHRDKVWPCVYRRWRNIRNHIVVQYRNIAATATQCAHRQLYVAYYRVRLSVATGDYFNRVPK